VAVELPSVAVPPTAVEQATMTVAFYGRVSTDDQQDPSLSIPRQLRKCTEALATIGQEVGPTYWEVDSGRKEMDLRGRGGRDWTDVVAVPRLGGLHELLDAAKVGAIDAVIVEEIERISRLSYDGIVVEHELEQLDIPLLAADEPLQQNATAFLTRRVKQGIAEWYVRLLLEKSRAGMEESVRQGWHTGGPAPYGYALEAHPHPNPNKAREGRVKHRLVVDPVRGPIVLRIFVWYVEDGLGLGAICERLNADLDRYPPPQRNKKDENELPQTWSKSQLHFMLRNPKYTGYNVWNRHDKRRGRRLVRPREQWVWSAEPTHEAIVGRELFDGVEERARRNDKPIGTKRPRAHARHQSGAGKRLYLLRGRVFCSLCGRRMSGATQKGKHWYRCQYAQNRGLAATDVSGHPRALGIKEEVVLFSVRDLMSRLFGPDRLDLVREELLDKASEGAWKERDTRLAHLRAEASKVEKALYRQALRLEEQDDPEHPVVKLAMKRIEELGGKEKAIAVEIAALEAQEPDGPRRDEIEAILASLPDLREVYDEAKPEGLMELFDAYDLAVTYDKMAQTLDLSVLLDSDSPGAPNDAEIGRSPGGRSYQSSIAGAGFEPATFGL